MLSKTVRRLAGTRLPPLFERNIYVRKTTFAEKEESIDGVNTEVCPPGKPSDTFWDFSC